MIINDITPFSLSSKPRTSLILFDTFESSKIQCYITYIKMSDNYSYTQSNTFFSTSYLYLIKFIYVMCNV
jgi:hypothetical protein